MTKRFKKDLTTGFVDWLKLPHMKLIGYFLFLLRKLLGKYALWTVLWLTFWRGSYCMCVSFEMACLWRRPVYKMSSIPSIVEQWRVPFPLAKRVAELVFPLVVHTPKSLEFSQSLFPRFVFEMLKPIVRAQNSSITVPFHPILINTPKNLFSTHECYWSCLNLIKLIFSV